MKYILSVALVGMAFCHVESIRAQQFKDSTLNRTVVVENQYNPEVMDAYKVNVLPKVEEPTVEKRNIEYATTSHPISTWTFSPIEALTPIETRAAIYRGYLRSAYGNRHNLDVKGSYLWDISKHDRLGVMASIYGFKGKKDFPTKDGNEWNARFFRTDASVDYAHTFQRVRLSADGAFASQVFNYMPIGPESPSQRFILGEGSIGIASTEKVEAVQYEVKAGVKQFSMKPEETGGERIAESHRWLAGYMAGRIDDKQKVGVALDFRSLSYNDSSIHPDYVQVQANPYYEVEGEKHYLRIGAKAAWQNKAEDGFLFASDVEFRYHFSNTYSFYVQALGGAQTNDFRRLNELTPYWRPKDATEVVTTNVPVDAKIGLKGSPYPGVAFHVFGGYKYMQHEHFVTMGEESLGNGGDAGASDSYYPIIALAQRDAHTAYAGASLDYEYKDLFHLSLSGSYHSWSVSGDNEDALLYLKPELCFELSARAKVYKDLYAGTKYRYEGRAGELSSGKADAVNNLSLMAGYEYAHRINVFLRFDNVLNQYYLTEAGFPIQGFTAMGGLSICF